MSLFEFASLFSGCGGFDQGFIDAGFTPRAAFDNDRSAVLNYSANIAPHAYRVDLTSRVPVEVILKNVPVVISGPPCQGFSTVGKRRVEDSRNALLPLAGQLSLMARPKVIVVENVAGGLAGAHFSYWKELECTLRLAGYKTHRLVCQSAALGMAQTRKRILLIAWRTKREFDFPVPTTKDSSQTLRDVLRNIEKAPNHFPENLQKNSTLWKIASAISPGQKLSNVRGGARAVHTWEIPQVFGPVSEQERTLLELILRLRRQRRLRPFGDADPVSMHRLEDAFGSPFRRLVKSLLKKGYLRCHGDKLDLSGTFNGKFRRFTLDGVSCTVDTRFGDPRYFLHPTKNRAFTVREAARIQGFKDDFVFQGDKKSQFRLIGNAVPPPVGKWVATIIRELARS